MTDPIESPIKGACCPACVLLASALTPLQALGIGVALGQHVSDPHEVTEAMCSEHRMPYVIGMMKAAALYYEATEKESADAD